VDDAVRRWLALQRDLGGDEVVLDAPMAIGAAGVSAPPAARGRSAPEGDAGASGQPAWKKGAPAIPGPGLTVAAPEPGLLDARNDDDSLARIAAEVAGCTSCQLCEARTHTVPGEGDPHARLMVVGEGPGESEDRLGRPFVGRAGELLDKMLSAIDLPRERVFIANVVKCRPPRNRAPLPEERAACLPYLRRQIDLVGPRVLLALGTTAAEALLESRQSLGSMRLKVHRWNGIPLIVTYHPAALLRNPNWKRPAWDDLRIARQLLDVD
jgi:uracil-DNA glycosylase